MLPQISLLLLWLDVGNNISRTTSGQIINFDATNRQYRARTVPYIRSMEFYTRCHIAHIDCTAAAAVAAVLYRMLEPLCHP